MVHGLHNFFSVVAAVKKPEAIIVECLCTHADTVDIERGKAGSKSLGHIVGIALYSQFAQVDMFAPYLIYI